MFNTNFLIEDTMDSSVSRLEAKSSAFRRFRSMPKPTMNLDDSFSDNEVENMSLVMDSVDNMLVVNKLSELDYDSSGDSGISSLDDESPIRGTDLDISESLVEAAITTPLVSRKRRPHRNLFDADTSSPISRDSPKSLMNRKPSRESNTKSHPTARRSLQSVVQKTTEPEMRTNTNIISALDSDEDNMISDFSKSYSLPTITGKHSDLKSISPEIMACLVRGDFSDTVGSCQIIDGRYPYEFEGGHIREASNIWERDTMLERFMKSDKKKQTSESDKRSIIIFHCEFSSERGPKMSRFLRKMDREANKYCYPSLYYPEMYLLDGGYKAFYEQYPELCDPHTYKPMIHPDHTNDVKLFRIKSKSWSGERSSKVSRRRQLLRQ